MMTHHDIAPGDVWADNAGHPIQAHGGGLLRHDGRWYWFGENKDAPNVTHGRHKRVDVLGVSAYRSDDLLNWEHLGVVLPAVNEPGHDLHPSRVVERPKVIHNARTDRFVMWFHADSGDYQHAACGVAVADSPAGPYRYLGSHRPCDRESRDMTVFADDDGTGYVVFSSDHNRVMRVARLSDDYTRAVGLIGEVFDGGGRGKGPEAPAVWKRRGRYHLLGSWCNGWNPTAACHFSADRISGPWTHHGNPCVGDGAEITFDAQSTFAQPSPGDPDAVLLMFDRWKPDDLRDSRYVWLPGRFDADGRLAVAWHTRWRPADLGFPGDASA